MIKKLSAGIATVALFTAFLTPVAAFANTGAVISGNGDGSFNSILLKNKTFSLLKQKSETNVSVEIGQTSSTGDNNANSNTGGTVTVTSGGAANTTIAGVAGGSNTGALPTCCCDQKGDTGATITGNGQGSFNNIIIKTKCSQIVKQSSKTNVALGVLQETSTGGNTANSNTGSGVTLGTGDATSSVTIGVTGGNNAL